MIAAGPYIFRDPLTSMLGDKTAHSLELVESSTFTLPFGRYRVEARVPVDAPAPHIPPRFNVEVGCVLLLLAV